MAEEESKQSGGNEHDTLFRLMVEDERRADILIRENLPAVILERLDKTRGRRVDAMLADVPGTKRCDALYEFKAKGGEPDVIPDVIYVLLEHKSWPDPNTPLQLQDYTTRIQARHVRDHPGQPTRLPLVVSMVFYHGDRPWNVPATIADMVDQGEASSEYTSKAKHVLVNLTKFRREDMSSDPSLRVLQTAMQKVRRNKKLARDTLVAILRDLPPDLEMATPDLEKATMWYILSVADVSRAELEEAAEIAKPDEKEKLMGTFVQECRQEGRLEGQLEGQLKEKSNVLTRQLEKRFGALPETARAQIAAAPAEQLDAWLDAVLTAESLQEVLGT